METADNSIELTQSQFVLAKYRIQLLENRPENTFQSPHDELDFRNFCHHHEGPLAIEHKPMGSLGVCDKDNCMQILWSFCLPCAYIHYFIISCFNSLCNFSSKITTNLEEEYTFQMCCLCRWCNI
ncbi:hypothetical protein RI129_010547 [Pyrocoelia pectoralis]|uniref:Uncharacterized protein n=1 Tax=Pyrocoelia pectoralis TaxID=417401 RepID=A0AAN7V779_9COLE